MRLMRFLHVYNCRFRNELNVRFKIYSVCMFLPRNMSFELKLNNFFFEKDNRNVLIIMIDLTSYLTNV